MLREKKKPEREGGCAREWEVVFQLALSYLILTATLWGRQQSLVPIRKQTRRGREKKEGNRHGNVKRFALGHTASKRQDWETQRSV